MLLRLIPFLRLLLVASFVLLLGLLGWGVSQSTLLPALQGERASTTTPAALPTPRPVGGTGAIVPTREPEPGPGADAPEFGLERFGGGTLRLSELRGQVVVLNFWASWCPPCRAEMPFFEKTYRAYRERGVTVVGVAIQDDPEDSRALLEELGITYPNGSDVGDEIALSYRVAGLPTTVFIGHDGKVAKKWLGSLSEQQLVALVEEVARW
jgi:peroxiredoxin